jgi:hypothetical protein
MSAANKKTTRAFQCRDGLWMTFEEMASELECSVDYLINDAMKQYARQRGYKKEASQTGSARPALPASPTAGAAPPPPAPSGATTAPLPPAAPLHAPLAATPGQSSAPLHAPQPAHAPPPAPAAARPPAPAIPAVSRAPAPPPLPATTSHSAAAVLPPPVPHAPAAHAPIPHAPPPPAPPPPGRVPTSPGRPTVPLSPDRLPPMPVGAPRSAAPAPPPPVPSTAPRRPIAAPITRALTIHYQGRPFQVTKDRFIIGRGKTTSDLTIRDPNVSRQHALVEFSGGNFYMVDMGSTNGIEFSGQGATQGHPKWRRVSHLRPRTLLLDGLIRPRATLRPFEGANGCRMHKRRAPQTGEDVPSGSPSQTRARSPSCFY